MSRGAPPRAGATARGLYEKGPGSARRDGPEPPPGACLFPRLLSCSTAPANPARPRHTFINTPANPARARRRTPARPQLNCAEGLPAEVTQEALADEAFLRAFHHALLEVHLEEGALVCPETGRRFKVSKGIPNMLLNEDEV